MTLTKRQIDTLSSEDKDYVAWDDNPRGLGVRVRPSGKKTFIIKYRTASGRQRKASLGAYGALTLDEARKRARRWLADAASGEDPADERQAARKATQFKDFAERYLKEYALPRKTPLSYEGDERMIRKRLIPTFGHLPLKDVIRQDISVFHQSMASTPYTANRHLALLSKIMNLAEEWGLKDEYTNPCRHVRKFKEEKRERYLTQEEIARLWSTLSACEESGQESDMACNAIRLLLLTGCRMSEILTLKWEYIKDGYLKLPHTKAGPQNRPISKQAQDLIASIEPVEGNPYVIRGKIPGTHLVEVKKAWQRIRRRADLEGVRLHDLRHTFASVAASNGISLRMIGELLGHRDVQTTDRYAHLTDAAVREAAEKMGSSLSTLTSIKTNEKKSEPLKEIL